MRSWIHRALRKLGFYGTLDTEKVLREKNRRILELEAQLAEEVQRRIASVRTICSTCKYTYEPIGKVAVYVDPRAQQKGYPQPTDYYQHHPGVLTRHHTDMQHKKTTRQLEPKTEILPKVPQPRKMHFHRLYAEPDSTFNAL